MQKTNFLIVKKSTISISIIFIILLKPAYIANIPGLSVVWQALKLICCFISLILYIYIKTSKKQMTFVEKVVIGYTLYMLINSFLRKNFFNTDIDELLVQVAVMMLVSCALSDHFISRLKLIIRIINIFFILNFITIVLYPNGIYVARNIYGINVGYWLLGNPNPASRFALITLSLNIIYSIISTSKLRKTDYYVGLMCVATAIICDSATTLIGFGVVFAIYLLSYWRKTSRHITVSLAFLVGTMLSVLIIMFGIQYKYSSIFLSFGRDTTFTGRTLIWDRAINLIKQSYVLGYGYQSKSLIYSAIGASHTHNFFLWVIYNGGIIGYIFMALLAFGISHEIKKVIDKRIIKISLSLIAAFYLMGVTEALTQMPLFFAIFIIVERICDYTKENNTVDKPTKHNMRLAHRKN